MLRVRSLDVAIGPVPIVREASLELSEGEMCGLIGRNGAGKTTLLRLLAGLMPPSRGHIETGQMVDLGYYAQEHESLHTGPIYDSKHDCPSMRLSSSSSISAVRRPRLASSTLRTWPSR